VVRLGKPTLIDLPTPESEIAAAKRNERNASKLFVEDGVRMSEVGLSEIQLSAV